MPEGRAVPWARTFPGHPGWTEWTARPRSLSLPQHLTWAAAHTLLSASLGSRAAPPLPWGRAGRCWQISGGKQVDRGFTWAESPCVCVCVCVFQGGQPRWPGTDPEQPKPSCPAPGGCPAAALRGELEAPVPSCPCEVPLPLPHPRARGHRQPRAGLCPSTAWQTAVLGREHSPRSLPSIPL